MQRRKFMIGLGAVAAGGAAVLGTGAFDSVTAERQLDIAIADDSEAYLQMIPHPEDPNRVYAAKSTDEQLSINMDRNGPTSGEGVNVNALTKADDVFRITNHGTQEVEVWVELPSPRVPADVDLYNSDTDESIVGQSNAVTLGVGDHVDVGISVDAGSQTNGDIFAPDPMVVRAEATN